MFLSFSSNQGVKALQTCITRSSVPTYLVTLKKFSTEGLFERWGGHSVGYHTIIISMCTQFQKRLMEVEMCYALQDSLEKWLG